MNRTKYPNPNNKRPPEERYRDGLPTDQLLPGEINLVQEVLVGRPYEEAVVNAGLMSANQRKQKRRDEAKAVLGLDRVQRYMREELLNRASRTRITNDRILAEMGKQAFFDPADAFDGNGMLKSFLDMDPATRAAIKEIDYEAVYAGSGKDKVKTGYIVNVKFKDQLPALKALYNCNNPEQQKPNVQVTNNNYKQNNVTVYDNRKQANLNDFSSQELGVLKKMIGAEDEEEIAELMEIEEQVQSVEEQEQQSC